MNPKTKKLVIIAMFCALSYAVMVVGRFPMVAFLKYDPKDVLIAICGFLYGPLSALIVSAVVSFVEMFTVSDTGPIGLLMNVLSTGAFACTAAWIYRRRKTLISAMFGLVLGSIVMTIVMLLWNYLMTPIYLGIHRDAVSAMLIPIFLPFNLIKSGINTAIVLLLYKPVVKIEKELSL